MYLGGEKCGILERRSAAFSVTGTKGGVYTL